MSPDQQLAEALAAWLAEGPGKAPDPSLRAALDHARRHPRRPDPLAVFRRDPMPARGRGAWGIRPASLALAAVGLLLVALAGTAIVGSLGIDRPSPVPTPTASASPTVAPPPSKGPVPTPIRVPIDTGTAARITVLVTDHSGHLSGATSGPASGGGSLPPGELRVTRETDDTLRLTWTDVACSIEYRLTIGADGSAIVLEAPPCEGDAIALDRVLLLTFDGPIDPGSVSATILPVD
jgi:hypothetical protein